MPERLLGLLHCDHRRPRSPRDRHPLHERVLPDLQVLEQRNSTAQQLTAEWKRIQSEIESKVTELKQIAVRSRRQAEEGKRHGGADQGGLLATISVRDVHREGHRSSPPSKALAADGTPRAPPARELRPYPRPARRVPHQTPTPCSPTFTTAATPTLRRREMYLYVFNQVFRERVLDTEIQRKMKDRSGRRDRRHRLAEVIESFLLQEVAPRPRALFRRGGEGPHGGDSSRSAPRDREGRLRR